KALTSLVSAGVFVLSAFGVIPTALAVVVGMVMTGAVMLSSKKSAQNNVPIDKSMKGVLKHMSKQFTSMKSPMVIPMLMMALSVGMVFVMSYFMGIPLEFTEILKLASPIGIAMGTWPFFSGAVKHVRAQNSQATALAARSQTPDRAA